MINYKVHAPSNVVRTKTGNNKLRYLIYSELFLPAQQNTTAQQGNVVVQERLLQEHRGRGKRFDSKCIVLPTVIEFILK